MSNLGSCWSAAPTLTFPSRTATGFRCVAEAIVRRWSTPRGGLIDDGNYGYDLTDQISGDFNVSDLSRIAQQAAAEAQKDERVLSCQCTATFVNEELSISGLVQTAAGPFRLVVSVSQVSVALLQPV